MKWITSLMIVLMLTVASQAITLEELIVGQPPTRTETLAGPDAALPEDNLSLILGLEAGPDVDSPDNEFGILGGIRYNLLEIGPVVNFYPKGDDHSTWGVYILRHLGYEDFLLGRQFFGFETNFGSGDGGDVYSFIGGTDVEIQPGVILRTAVKYRTFDDALADTHAESHDKFVFSAGPVFRF